MNIVEVFVKSKLIIVGIRIQRDLGWETGTIYKHLLLLVYTD